MSSSQSLSTFEGLSNETLFNIFGYSRDANSYLVCRRFAAFIFYHHDRDEVAQYILQDPYLAHRIRNGAHARLRWLLGQPWFGHEMYADLLTRWVRETAFSVLDDWFREHAVSTANRFLARDKIWSEYEGSFPSRKITIVIGGEVLELALVGLRARDTPDGVVAYRSFEQDAAEVPEFAVKYFMPEIHHLHAISPALFSLPFTLGTAKLLGVLVPKRWYSDWWWDTMPPDLKNAAERALMRAIRTGCLPAIAFFGGVTNIATILTYPSVKRLSSKWVSMEPAINSNVMQGIGVLPQRRHVRECMTFIRQNPNKYTGKYARLIRDLCKFSIERPFSLTGWKHIPDWFLQDIRDMSQDLTRPDRRQLRSLWRALRRERPARIPTGVTIS